jgi:hypothetical protein
MHPAINPIMFKGFMLGYLHKTAYGPTPEDLDRQEMDRQNEGGPVYSSETGAPSGAQIDGGGPASLKDENVPAPETGAPSGPQDGAPSGPQGYGPLGAQLKDLWPGAAAGAIGTGAASIGVDSLRGQPPNIRRAILLSLVLGIPLGAAGQMGVMGGVDAYKQFGSNVAASGKQGLADILKKWGEGKTWAGKQVDKGQGIVGKTIDLAKKVPGAANTALHEGVGPGVKKLQ